MQIMWSYANDYPQTFQYRVWDEEDKQYIEKYIYLALDGFLYSMVQDMGDELLRPRWFDDKMQVEWYSKAKSSLEFSQITAQIEEEIRKHQHEWFRIELATGYKDVTGKMIYQGDLVEAKYYGGPQEVTWFVFEDCCVNGHTWMLGYPDPAKSTLFDALRSGDVKVVGTIHDAKAAK